LVHEFPFRYFFRYEVEHLLTQSGFKVAELFGNFDRSPLTNNSPEMIFVAEKCQNVDFLTRVKYFLEKSRSLKTGLCSGSELPVMAILILTHCP
jgi:hypothetical protein